METRRGARIYGRGRSLHDAALGAGIAFGRRERIGGRCWHFNSVEQDAFSADHLRILQAISSKLALSVENAVKYQQAEDSATTDYLTGLPNARSLFIHLDKEISRCARTDNNLAIMVCDINGFKQVNDNFGHLEGDRMLRIFAQNVKNACREYDYVARMGGDEFVIVVPNITRLQRRKRRQCSTLSR